MKCLNCDAEAVYRVENDSSDDQFYCKNDLPEFFNWRGYELRVKNIALEDTPKEEAPKAKKKAATPAPEPTPEPVIVEEKTEETPVE